MLVLRGEGRRRHQPMAFETIRKYLSYLYPVLTAWSGRVTSLREITPDDIRHVLRQRPGQPAQDLASALRSLMRVFGISDTTAMKYVHAAHPERLRAGLPVGGEPSEEGCPSLVRRIPGVGSWPQPMV